MFAGAWWYYGPSLLLVARLVFGCALIVLFAIDLEHHLLPNAITLPGIVVGFVFSFFTEPGWLASLIGILLGGGILFAIGGGLLPHSRRGRPGHGRRQDAGDDRRVSRLAADLLTLMLASFAGSVIGGGMIVLQRGGMKTRCRSGRSSRWARRSPRPSACHSSTGISTCGSRTREFRRATPCSA